jgi:TRAP-type mannitol/chloroaromatic compound transport system permease large subunit
MNAGVILFLIFAVCVLIGVPISMSLGIGSLAAVALGNLGVSPAVIAQRVFGGLQSTSIMAIAFFILAGNLMAGGGSDSPDEFNYAMFSWRRITLAPILVIGGFIIGICESLIKAS